MNLLDFLFPPRCLGCQKFGSFFCSSCREKIVFVPQVCPVCERPSVGGKTHLRCQTHYSLDGLVSFYAYEGPVRSALRRLKYKPFAFGGARDLVGPAFDFVKENPAVFAPLLSLLSLLTPLPHIVPIPLHSSRFRWRGFNQARVLAEVFAKEWKLEIAELLIRKKETSPQAGLDAEERRKNIVSAFSVCRIIVVSQYPNIVLFDDIWTTGATLRAAGMILKRAGAKTVWGLTLAQ